MLWHGIMFYDFFTVGHDKTWNAMIWFDVIWCITICYDQGWGNQFCVTGEPVPRDRGSIEPGWHLYLTVRNGRQAYFGKIFDQKGVISGVSVFFKNNAPCSSCWNVWDSTRMFIKCVTFSVANVRFRFLRWSGQFLISRRKVPGWLRIVLDLKYSSGKLAV